MASGHANCWRERCHSLAKTESASTVGDYRPITVFGLAYRAWSSLHSRHLLAWAEQWVDDSVYGNRQGRQAADLWHHVMLHVKNRTAQVNAFQVLSADIEKCFNCIPRFPGTLPCGFVGTPHAVTTAWQAPSLTCAVTSRSRTPIQMGSEPPRALQRDVGLVFMACCWLITFLHCGCATSPEHPYFVVC